jgi:hypothetical protein
MDTQILNCGKSLFYLRRFENLDCNIVSDFGFCVMQGKFRKPKTVEALLDLLL